MPRSFRLVAALLVALVCLSIGQRGRLAGAAAGSDAQERLDADASSEDQSNRYVGLVRGGTYAERRADIIATANEGGKGSEPRYITDETALLRDAMNNIKGTNMRSAPVPRQHQLAGRSAKNNSFIRSSQSLHEQIAASHGAQKRGVLVLKNTTSATGQWRRRVIKRATKFMGRSMATLSKKSKNTTTCIAELLSDDITEGWFVNLTSAAQRLNRRGSVVLTGGDWNYRGVLMNWMAMMDRLNIVEYLVFCYDERLLNIVGPWESGGHGILTPNCTTIQEFMYLKLVGVNALIHAGYSATWSDCDCVWLRPFLDQWILPYGSEYDVIGQRALHPRGISNKTGAVLCTGLFTVFPTERSIMLLELALDLVLKTEEVSDQLILNQALLLTGAYSTTNKMLYYHRDSIQSPLSGNDSAPRLGLLPYEPFPRTPNGMAYLRQSLNASVEPYVYHVRSAKVGIAKVALMSNLRMWALRASWSLAKTRAEYRNCVDLGMVLVPPWDETQARKKGLVRRGAMRIEQGGKNKAEGRVR
jgi:hypothetical protein